MSFIGKCAACGLLQGWLYYKFLLPSTKGISAFRAVGARVGLCPELIFFKNCTCCKKAPNKTSFFLPPAK